MVYVHLSPVNCENTISDIDQSSSDWGVITWILGIYTAEKT